MECQNREQYKERRGGGGRENCGQASRKVVVIRQRAEERKIVGEIR